MLLSTKIKKLEENICILLICTFTLSAFTVHVVGLKGLTSKLFRIMIFLIFILHLTFQGALSKLLEGRF